MGPGLLPAASSTRLEQRLLGAHPLHRARRRLPRHLVLPPGVAARARTARPRAWNRARVVEHEHRGHLVAARGDLFERVVHDALRRPRQLGLGFATHRPCGQPRGWSHAALTRITLLHGALRRPITKSCARPCRRRMQARVRAAARSTAFLQMRLHARVPCARTGGPFVKPISALSHAL